MNNELEKLNAFMNEYIIEGLKYRLLRKMRQLNAVLEQIL